MRLIDADALKKAIKNSPLIDFTDDDIFILMDNAPTFEYVNNTTYMKGHLDGYKQAIIDGKLDYSRPHSKWIQYRKGHYTGVKCSLCDTIMDFTTNYCPKCGADMR